MGQIKALIFDFDGLILETEGPIYQSWLELYAFYGVDLPLSTWSHTIGAGSEAFDPLQNLETQVGHPLDLQSIIPIQRARERELIAAQPIRPGVESCLADARQRGLRIGLASSSPCEWVTGYLAERSLISYFDCIRGRDDVRLAKPDPELYLSVLAALDIQACEAIAFEDSPNGIRAAKAAGIFCVAVPSPLTRQLSLDQADLQLDSLADLPLEKLLPFVPSKNP
jgi:HAD superfamily hydrolase (TIGR01509 family)